MAIDLENVLPSVVVNVNESASPGNVLIVNADARRERNIAETSIPLL